MAAPDQLLEGMAVGAVGEGPAMQEHDGRRHRATARAALAVDGRTALHPGGAPPHQAPGAATAALRLLRAVSHAPDCPGTVGASIRTQVRRSWDLGPSTDQCAGAMV